MFKRNPDVYSVQFLVARKDESSANSSRRKAFWLIVGALLLICIVTISIVLGIVYTRWDNRSFFEEDSSADTYPDDAPVKAALQHDAQQKDKYVQSISPSAVSPLAPFQDGMPGDIHLHPVITPKRIALGLQDGQFEGEAVEVDVLEMKMSVPSSLDVKSQEFEDEVAKALQRSFLTGEQRQAGSQARRKREALDPNNVTVNITNITRLDDATVVVDFFIVENGRVVESAAAIAAYSELSEQELENTILAEVISLIAVSDSSVIFTGKTQLPSLSTEPVESMLSSFDTIETSSIVFPISSSLLSSGEITPSASFFPTQSSSVVVAPIPDKLLGVEIIMPENYTSVDDPLLKTNLESKLAQMYIDAKQKIQARRKRAVNNVEVKVTDIKQIQSSRVAVEFYVQENGNVVPAETAVKTFAQLSPEEKSAILQTQVVSEVVLVFKSSADNSSTSPVIGASSDIQSSQVLSDSSQGSLRPSLTGSFDSSLIHTSGVRSVSSGEVTLSVPDSSQGSTGLSLTGSFDTSLLQTPGIQSMSSGEITLSVEPDSSQRSLGPSLTGSFDTSLLRTSGVSSMSSLDISAVPNSSQGSLVPSVSVSLDSSFLQTSEVLSISSGEITLSVAPDSSQGSLVPSVSVSLDSSFLQTSEVLSISSGEVTLSVAPDSSQGSLVPSVSVSLDSSFLQTSEVLSVSSGEITLSVAPDSSQGSLVPSVSVSLDSSFIQTSEVLSMSSGEITLSVVPDSSQGSFGTSVTSSVDGSVIQTSGVSSVSPGEITPSASSQGLPVASSSAVISPNQNELVFIRVKLPQNFSSTADPDLSSYLKQKLAEIYITGKARPGNRRKRATGNVEVQVTAITEAQPEGVDVRFYVVEDGNVVPAETVMAAFAKLSDQEQSDILGTQILSPLAPAVPVVTPSETQSSQVLPDSSQASSDLSASFTLDSSVLPTSLVLSASPGEITPSPSSQLMPSSSDVFSTSDVPTQTDSYSLVSSYTLAVESSASPSIAPTKPLSTSSVVLTSSATTPVPQESNLLRITFKLNKTEDIHGEEFRKRIAEALKQAYIKGRDRSESQKRKKREVAVVDNSQIKIYQICKEGDNGIVHFQVIDSALTAQDILNIFDKLKFDELKAMLPVELLEPGVERVSEDTIICGKLTVSSTSMTSTLESTTSPPFPPTLSSLFLLSSSSDVLSTATLSPFTSFLFTYSSSDLPHTLMTTTPAVRTTSSEMSPVLTGLSSSQVIMSSTALSDFLSVSLTSSHFQAFTSNTSMSMSSSSTTGIMMSSPIGSGSSTFDSSPAIPQPSVSTSSIYSSLTSTTKTLSFSDGGLSGSIPSTEDPSMSSVFSSTTLESSVFRSSSGALKTTVISPTIVISETSFVSSTSFHTDSAITESFQTSNKISLGSTNSIITYSSTTVGSSSFPSSIVIKSTDFSDKVSSIFFSTRNTVSVSSESTFITSPLDYTSVTNTGVSVTEFPVTSYVSPRITPYLSTSSTLSLPASTVPTPLLSITPTMSTMSSSSPVTPTTLTFHTLSVTPVTLTPTSAVTLVTPTSSVTPVIPTKTSTATPVTPTPPSTVTQVTPTPTSTVTPVTSTPPSTVTQVTPTPTSTVTPMTPTPPSTVAQVTPTPTSTVTPVTSTPTITVTPVTSTPTSTVTPVTSTPTPTVTPVTSTPTATVTPVTSTPTLTVTPVTSTPTPTVTPVTTSAPSKGHSLSRLTIQVKTVINVHSEFFKATIQSGLENCYVEALLFGQIRRKKREVFISASGNYSLAAQVTDVNRKSETPRTVVVDFYVEVNGGEVPAEQVSSTLNRLSLAELSAITRYPVLEAVRPVTADTGPSTDDKPNDDLAVILPIVIPSVLVTIAIVLFLIWYCRNNDVRTGISVAKDPETLRHHNLDVDIERGDIVKKSMTWKSTSTGSLTLKKKATPLAIEVEEPIESTPPRVLKGTAPPLTRSASFERYFPNLDSKGRRNDGYLHEDDWLIARDRRGKDESHYERAEFDSRESLDPCYSPISEESIVRSYIPTPVTDMEEEPVLNSPSTFANVAKMSRIAMADNMFPASPPDVKYRPVAGDSQGADDLSGSILEDRRDIERHRNKQRQRERIRKLEEEKQSKPEPPVSDTKMDQRDRHSPVPAIERQEIGTQSDSPVHVSPAEGDDHDGRERTKLGRHMRARPRRPDKRGVEQNEPLQQPLLNPEAESASPLESLYFSPSLHPAYSTPSGQVIAPQTNPLIESPQHPTQDLLETLNRQQQLVSNPVREHSPSPDTEDAKRRAQRLINDSFLLEQIQQHRRKQEQMKEMNQLLSDAFPLANSGIINGDIEVTSIANGTVTPNDSEQLQFHRLHLNGGDSLEMETETDAPLMSGLAPFPSSSFVPESPVQSPSRHNQMNGHVPTGFDENDMNPRLRKAIRGELRKPQPTKL